jgi:DinB superfamily
MLERLATMPGFLARTARRFTDHQARRPGRDGAFSFVQNVWHLADLEREGYGARIQRLRREEQPVLPDFDGARLARERDYQARSVAEGLAAFAAAREVNLAALRQVKGGEWGRGGEQEGKGPVTPADLPRMMLEHDDGHRAEILALLGESVHEPGALTSR